MTFVTASEGHEHLKLKTLTEKEGLITFKLFGKLGELEGEGDGDAEGEGDGEQGDSNSVYVEDVVREKKMHFFSLPKLGSYFAVKVDYQCCLMPGFFADALKDKIECTDKRNE